MVVKKPVTPRNHEGGAERAFQAAKCVLSQGCSSGRSAGSWLLSHDQQAACALAAVGGAIRRPATGSGDPKTGRWPRSA